eukprot:jgi/Chlat1/9196/Chrsp97S08466
MVPPLRPQDSQGSDFYQDALDELELPPAGASAAATPTAPAAAAPSPVHFSSKPLLRHGSAIEEVEEEDEDYSKDEGVVPLLHRTRSAHYRLQQCNKCLFASLGVSFLLIAGLLIGLIARGHHRDCSHPLNQSHTRNPYFDGRMHAKYSKQAAKIIETADDNACKTFGKLETLCATFGNRYSGSDRLEAAIDWVHDRMAEDGLDNVHKEPVAGISNWQRGIEEAHLITPRLKSIQVLGLGGSISGNLTADVLVVASFEELEARSTEAVGKIVLFNAPFVNYGVTVAYRVGGAVAAAKAGAVAALVRSVGPFSMYTPHTGAMQYEDGVTRVPTACVTTEDADLLQYIADAGQAITVHLQLESVDGPPADSFNLMGEVTGTDLPNEVVVVGGHIDSWDVGEGAMDDGAGMLASWEAVRLLKSLNLRARRTVRAVAFVNEEQGGGNGVLGGAVYADVHRNERHTLAIESDSGAFLPLGYYVNSHISSEMLAHVRAVASTLLAQIAADSLVSIPFSGTDIEPLYETQGTPGLELYTNATRYFWYHHTNADTPDKLNATEIARCAAVIAIMAHVIADLPDSTTH